MARMSEVRMVERTLPSMCWIVSSNVSFIGTAMRN